MRERRKKETDSKEQTNKQIKAIAVIRKNIYKF
jgi:hypothetical protein